MTLRSTITWGVLALALTGWQGAAAAAQHHPIKHLEGNAAGLTKTEFVKHAAQGGLAEVALGNLGVQKAQSDDVKQFAQRMVDDHSKANDELMDLARKQAIDIPKQMSAEQRATVDRLSKLSGAAFDREYMKAMVKDHDHDVAMFETYSQHGKDEQLKSWAAKTLPTLQDHKEMATATANKVGANMAVSARHRTEKTARGATH